MTEENPAEPSALNDPERQQAKGCLVSALDTFALLILLPMALVWGMGIGVGARVNFMYFLLILLGLSIASFAYDAFCGRLKGPMKKWVFTRVIVANAVILAAIVIMRLIRHIGD